MNTFLTATGRQVRLDNAHDIRTLDGHKLFHVTTDKLNALISSGSLSPLMPALTK